MCRRSIAYWAVATSVALSGCGTVGGEPAFVVNAHDLKRGDPNGVSFTVNGRPGYDKIWSAAVSAMSNGMTIIESHKPTGVIKSRVGTAPSGKIVGMFITPTAPRAIEYQVETSSVRPLGWNSLNGRGWEPTVVENFKEALNAK